MSILSLNPWALFCLAFGLMLLATWLMGRQGQRMITMDPVRRQVSITALEFPSDRQEIANIMQGFFRLPAAEQQSSIWSLKSQLITDFLLFMPGAYGGIAIMCLQVAGKMSEPGYYLFTALAGAQALCFLLDTIENIYFWNKIRPDAQPASKTGYRLLQVLEGFKWGLALLGAVCGFSAISYFWLSGQYHQESLLFVGIFFAEILIFLWAARKKPQKA